MLVNESPDGAHETVSDIEEGGMSLAYAKMAKELPLIEATVAGGVKS